MTCPRCQQENRPDAKYCDECGTPATGADLAKPHADLKDENEGLRRSLTEALEQQTAAAEILRVISSTATDLRPVFAAMAARAARLCDAFDATIFQVDGDVLRLVAHEGPITPDSVLPLTPGTIGGRVVQERRAIHVADMQAETETYPLSSGFARDRGFRAILSVPLLHGAQAIGLIAIRRAEVRPFTDRQVELVKTFADQAVIAIENVRLFTELQEKNGALTQAHSQVTEALEQQTATAEILGVISSSPTDIGPVFQAIVRRAVTLCEGFSGIAVRLDAGLVHLAAHFNLSLEAAEVLEESYPRAPTRDYPAGRAIVDRARVHVFAEDGIAREFPAMAARGRTRSLLAVPLLREGQPIGAINITRTQAMAFTERQIALLQTFAAQAVIAIENVRLFTELQASNHDLTTALDKQTATSEILRVISRSQTDVQPVFDAIVHSAVRLLRAYTGALTRIVGDQIEIATLTSADVAGDAALRARFPQSLHSEDPHAQVVRARVPLTVADAQTDTRWPEAARAYARVRGYRSAVVVPMLRRDEVIGSIGVNRREPGGFTDDEIALLQAFADQAVIAIENVRLFKELEARNRDLTAALEQQTATSEILRVISSSPTDLQPVLAAVAENAARVCGAIDAQIYRVEGESLRWVASHGPIPPLTGLRPINREWVTGRAVVDRCSVHVHDLAAESATEYPIGKADQAQTGHRTTLATPLLREGVPLGAIVIRRLEVAPFSDKQVRLLETFADQAVIAIENVRLFKELEARNRDLTATSEILRVISTSPTDVQPVFDTMVESAVRLCEARFGAVFLLDGGLVHLAAQRNFDESQLAVLRAQYPMQPKRGHVSGRAIVTGATVQIPDIFGDEEFRVAGAVGAMQTGFRSLLGVPMLRGGRAIGAIVIYRSESGEFADKHIELLKTFADQAVIAIENVRLFRELQARTSELTRSVDELTALGDVGRALSSTLNLETVLQTIVTRANQLARTAGCVIWEYDKPHEEFRLRVSHYADDSDSAILPARGGVTTIPKGQGLTTKVMEERQAVQIPDITVAGAYESLVRKPLIDAGHRALLGVPLLSEDEVVGVLAVTRKTPGEFEPETVRLLSTFATQSALAIQNARLFREIEQKSRELEAASRHKSEFLANMSHELRTPLNAIIGFSEVLSERMFGELNEKQDEYLKDIHASGQHLLSLINDILDLSKIEAGRMELEVTEFDLPMAIDNALTLVRERAARRGIVLHTTVDQRVGQIQADERKVRQVLLNLLSNAIKFTPEGGRIGVQARPVNGSVEVSVSDTGVGIAPEDQEAVFEEFRQVGTADKKVEGTGLGLALSRKFIELHGGKIWVKSQVGHGSTFTFTVPVRGGE